MTTSKLEQNLTTKFSTDYVAINNDVLQGIIKHAIIAYQNTQIANQGGIEKRTFYLVKRPSKKFGFIYQVKYIDNTGRILPTKYSTGTNDFETANKWAVENRDSCLTAYNGKAEMTLLENYYSDDSKFFEYEKMDGRELCALARKQRNSFMRNHIVPFFQSKKIHYLNQITPIHIKELKKFLSTEKQLKPQTINYNLVSFKKCLSILKDMGKITTDFSTCSFTQKGSSESVKDRGVYGIDTLKGVFNKQWKNELYRVLCMIIYFTGIRNSEIQRIRFNDIQKINDVCFLNVRGTKSKNAVRKVPLHPTLYKAVKTYADKNGIGYNDILFEGLYNSVFRKASFEMGSLLGFTQKELLKKGICFYSGRHTFKSVLAIGNAEKVADLDINYQELFMGHNFSKEQLKKDGINEYAYKHLNADVLGDSLFTEKGKAVFKIINRYYI